MRTKLVALFLFLFLLLPATASAQQSISGSVIRDATLPAGKLAPVAAQSLIGNCTGSSASPGACSATQAKDAIGIVRRFEDYGAVGDGAADDTNALKAAAAAGVVVEGRPGATYRITSRVFGFVNGTRWRGNGARIYMPAASFTNANLASRYCDTCVGLDLSGLRSSPFTPVRDIEVSGFIVESQVQDGRHVGAIACLNVADLVIRDNEIYGFPVGAGVRCGSLSGDSKISRNYIHDFYTDATWPSIPQSTGIEVDNDRVSTILSTGVEIADNRIERIGKGSASIAAWGYQTDGINVQNGTGYRVTGNFIDAVGEGIDTFGSDGVYSRNVILRAYESGIKVCHGGSRNVVAENVVRSWGVGGLYVCGDQTVAVNTDGNLFEGNSISDGDYLGAWASSNMPAGIYIAPDATHAGKVINQTFLRNRIEPGAAEYNYLDFSTVGGHFASDVFVARGSIGFVNVNAPGTTRFLTTTPESLFDAAQIAPAADLVFGFRNISSTAGSAVTLDLNPASATSRKAAISAINGGGNAIALTFCTSNSDVCTERARLSAAGEFVVGHTSPLSVGGATLDSQIVARDSGAGGLFARFQNGSVGPRIWLLTSRSSTPGAFAAVQNGDEVGAVGFFGDDGSDYNGRFAEISVRANAATGTNSLPGRIDLRVTPVGSDSPQTIVSLTGSGVDSANGRGLKHGRAATGSVPATSSALVTLTWAAAFADASYTATCSVADSTAAAAALRVVHLESVTAAAVAVRVENTSIGALSGTLHCIAMHD